jgi:enoyl-CoA hydratase/carnithine racemase
MRDQRLTRSRPKSDYLTGDLVILTGAGKHFCGGADLRDFAERAQQRGASGTERQGSGSFVTLRRDLFSALEESRVPVIAAINGAAMGGGYEIALACDVRVMSDAATIGLPEIRFGALPAGGGTQRLPRRSAYSSVIPRSGFHR